MAVYYTTQSHREANGFQEFQDRFVRIGADSLDELERFYLRYRNVEGISKSMPPASKSLSSGIYPHIKLPKDKIDAVWEDDLLKIPGPYMGIVNWFLKEEWWKLKEPKKDRKGYAKISEELKAHTVTLLFSRMWLEDTSDQRLKNLHNKIKKIDLGRWHHLNYVITQSDKDLAQRNRFKKIDFKQRKQEEEYGERLAQETLKPVVLDDVEVERAISGPEEEAALYAKFNANKHKIPGL